MNLRKRLIAFKLIWLPCFQRYWALRRHLPAKGFFVEAGAHDGITQSNTIGLEWWSGWRGILVEPIPELAMHCRRNRPAAIVAECALVSNDYENSHIDLWNCGLMSVVKGSHPEESIHLQQGESYQDIKSTLVRTSAKTLNNILSEHQISHVDFLSLDLEGYEIMALKGLGVFKPTFLLLETVNEEVESFLSPFYHKICTIGDDTLFRANI